MTTLKVDMFVKIKYGESEKHPKCGSIRKVKHGFNRGNPRYFYRYCAFNYMGTKKGYTASVKRRNLRYYLERIGFIRKSYNFCA